MDTFLCDKFYIINAIPPHNHAFCEETSFVDYGNHYRHDKSMNDDANEAYVTGREELEVCHRNSKFGRTMREGYLDCCGSISKGTSHFDCIDLAVLAVDYLSSYP